MDERNGKIYDKEIIDEIAYKSKEQAEELKKHLISISESQADELKMKSLKERLGWLTEFRKKNKEIKNAK